VASRKDNLKHRYGITESQFDQMAQEQNHCCKICNKAPTKRGLFVDHCHKTKNVRGLLCYHCNIALGHMKDEPTRLEEAAAYLRNAAA
jgi:sulfur relay (sulfurtransferase) complex TusBCD TusD component (DsrE family)